MKRSFLKNKDGATAIEYALIASLIFFAILGAVRPVGEALNTLFGQAEAGFDTAD
ncbi:MAG TPA: Flp family type IVb pilin [Terricaulis sp.]|nr:Flp family type IVb pilin [Terricaulis sp.]HRP12162.1 Flp family type IVb pilin [Terricaulis sp.]